MAATTSWRKLTGLAAALLLVSQWCMTLSAAPISTTTRSISAKTSIFSAGQNSGVSGSIVPDAITLANSGQQRSLTLSQVAGTTSWSGLGLQSNADGLNLSNSQLEFVQIQGASGISGYTGPRGLTGVFLDDAAPASRPAPAPLSYDAAGILGKTYSPQIGQTFFLGDGLAVDPKTSQSSVQTFSVPLNATRLYLGFADTNNMKWEPGAYTDNTGALQITANLLSHDPNMVDCDPNDPTPAPVPEPASIAVWALALAGLGYLKHRRTR